MAIVYLFGNKKYYIESLMSGDVFFGYVTVGVKNPESVTGSINYLLKNMLSPLRIGKVIFFYLFLKISIFI